MLVACLTPVSRVLFPISHPRRKNTSTIRPVELCASRFSFYLILAPMFHLKGCLGEIGSPSATGNMEEGTIPVVATVNPMQPLGDHI